MKGAFNEGMNCSLWKRMDFSNTMEMKGAFNKGMKNAV